MKRSLLSCCLLALALLTAHPAPAADMANTLVYAGENEDTINPVLSPHQELPTIIFSGLMKFDAKGLPVPDLAKSVDYDPKTLTYTFHLRDGVKWHDGAPFSARDVVYTYTALTSDKTLTSTITSNYQDISRISAPDERTVVIRLARVNAAMLDNFCMGILPAHLYEGHDINTVPANHAPVGTGRFKFVSWEKDQKVVLEKNPDYYGEVPQIDQLVFRVIPEAADRVAALQAGEVDIICNIPTTQAEYLESLDGISVVGQPSTRVVWLQFNLVGGPTPLDDVRVRQAINYAVDRDALIAGVLDGYAVKVASISTPEYEGYDPNVQGYTYDVEKAKQLMADAGYADGFDIECSVSPGLLNSTDVVQAIASQLAQIGINVTIKQEDSATQRDEIGAGTVAPLFLQGLGGPYCDINLIASIGFTEGARYCTWVSPEFMDLASQAASEMDAEKRVALYSQMQQMMVDEAPALWLYQQDTLYAYNSKKVQNWTARTDEVVLMDGVSVAG